MLNIALCLLATIQAAATDTSIDAETLAAWSAPYRGWHY